MPSENDFLEMRLPIRVLTSDEQARLLTQDEVDRLPEEALVWIKWSGGNGPHLYRVGRFREEVWAVSLAGALVARIDFVGMKGCQTRVFVATEVTAP